ncbi:hypothetical protein HS125_16435 [bacterium]|nr:hypothetical protein [bacterium]
MRGLALALIIIGIVALSPPARAVDESGALPLPVKSVDAATVTPLLDPDAPAWSDAPESLLRFNRTPPLYVGDATDDGHRPEVRMRALRLPDGSLVLCARWSDATKTTSGRGVRYPDAGDPHIYPIHTENTGAFPDAFCAMVPKRRGPQSPYPSMMMGEKADPVELYYWRAGVGLELLAAHGRASTAPGGTAQPFAARYHDGGWTLIVVLPSLTPKTPLCFAVWDGERQQRDGLKYFSLWYEAQ